MGCALAGFGFGGGTGGATVAGWAGGVFTPGASDLIASFSSHSSISVRRTPFAVSPVVTNWYGILRSDAMLTPALANTRAASAGTLAVTSSSSLLAHSAATIEFAGDVDPEPEPDRAPPTVWKPWYGGLDTCSGLGFRLA